MSLIQEGTGMRTVLPSVHSRLGPHLMQHKYCSQQQHVYAQTELLSLLRCTRSWWDSWILDVLGCNLLGENLIYEGTAGMLPA